MSKNPPGQSNQLKRRNYALASEVKKLKLRVAELESKLAKPASVGAFVQLMEEINDLADTTLTPLLLADGLEDALIGYTLNHHHPVCAVYDYGKCMTVLQQRDNMTSDEAEECLSFNTLGAYVGESGPLFVRIPT